MSEGFSTLEDRSGSLEVSARRSSKPHGVSDGSRQSVRQSSKQSLGHAAKESARRSSRQSASKSPVANRKGSTQSSRQSSKQSVSTPPVTSGKGEISGDAVDIAGDTASRAACPVDLPLAPIISNGAELSEDALDTVGNTHVTIASRRDVPSNSNYWAKPAAVGNSACDVSREALKLLEDTAAATGPHDNVHPTSNDVPEDSPRLPVALGRSPNPLLPKGIDASTESSEAKPSSTWESLTAKGGTAQPNSSAARGLQDNGSTTDQICTPLDKNNVLESHEEAGLVGTVRCSVPLGADPLQYHHLLFLVLATALPTLVVIVLISSLAYGHDVYNYLFEARVLRGGIAMFFLAVSHACFLYVIDIFERVPWVQGFHLLIFMAFIFGGAMMASCMWPWLLMLCTLGLAPVCVLGLRMKPCRTVDRLTFYTSEGTVLLVVGTTSFFVWLLATLSDGHVWGDERRYALIADSAKIYENVYSLHALDYDSHCRPGVKLEHLSAERQEAIAKACATAATAWFIAYTSPFLACVSNLALACFCFCQRFVVITRTSSLQRTMTYTVLASFVLHGQCYAIKFFTSAKLNLTSALGCSFIYSLLVLVGWAVAEVGGQGLFAAFKSSSAAEFAVKAWKSDWIKAFVLGPIFLFIPLLTLLDRWRQALRQSRGRSTSDDVHTAAGRKLLNGLISLNLSGIFVRMCLLGELFFALQVGFTKFTYVFLSWLNEALEPLGFHVVNMLVVVIGFIMFMLPPVPGIPVYVFTGIMVTDQARRDDSIGFNVGVLVAILLSVITKLCACVGQYFIGYFMGQSLKIQQLICVDKVPTRAIEQILKRKGLDIGKVAILIGGPDWPTSVTCGILKVNIPQMLLGTLPIVFICSPCVLSGAFLARVEGPGDDWAKLSNLAITASVVCQGGSALVALVSITRLMASHWDELAKHRPEHDAVAALTRKEQKYTDTYLSVTAWVTMSTWRKVIIISAVFFFILSDGAFFLAGRKCFRPFYITSKIDDAYTDNGLEGNPLNIILAPHGYMALILFFLGCFLHWLHCKLASRRAAQLLHCESE